MPALAGQDPCISPGTDLARTVQHIACQRGGGQMTRWRHRGTARGHTLRPNLPCHVTFGQLVWLLCASMAGQGSTAITPTTL